MKRTIGFLLAVCLLLASACGGSTSSESPAPEFSPAPSAPPVSTESTEPQETPGDEPEGSGTLDESTLPVVYMTTDISPEGLMAVYEALGC